MFGGGGGTVPIPAPPPEPVQMPEIPAIEFPPFPEFPAYPEFPAPYDPEVGAAKRRGEEEQVKLREIERRRKGYQSTLLTGGQGLTDDPSLRKPSLLGR